MNWTATLSVAFGALISLLAVVTSLFPVAINKAQIASSNQDCSTSPSTYASPSNEESADCHAGTAVVDLEHERYPAIRTASNVYNESCYPFVGADPKTFVALSAYYSKDATHVWYDGGPAGNTILPPIEIPCADPLSFTLIQDPNEFEGFSAAFTKDKSHVYDFGELMQGVDPTTFVITSNANGIETYSP
jgi:hypothetical protein